MYILLGIDSVAARVLLGMVIPGHIIFVAAISISPDSQNSVPFVIFYLLASIIQVNKLNEHEVLLKFFTVWVSTSQESASFHIIAFKFFRLGYCCT